MKADNSKISANSAELYNYVRKTLPQRGNLYQVYIGENKLIFVEFRLKKQIMAMQKTINNMQMIANSSYGIEKFGAQNLAVWEQGMKEKAKMNFIEFAPDIIQKAYELGLVLYSAFFKYDCFYLAFGAIPKK